MEAPYTESDQHNKTKEFYFSVSRFHCIKRTIIIYSCPVTNECIKKIM